MDYESERLDAYDASDAMRFVAGAVNREDPIEENSEVTGLFDLDLINQQATALADSLVDGGPKVLLGGVRDAAQAALQGAGDLVESRAERYVDLGLLDQPDNPLELQVPVRKHTSRGLIVRIPLNVLALEAVVCPSSPGEGGARHRVLLTATE